jgi:hypothetical protein
MNTIIQLLLEKYGKWVLIGAIVYFGSEVVRNYYATKESVENIKVAKKELK